MLTLAPEPADLPAGLAGRAFRLRRPDGSAARVFFAVRAADAELLAPAEDAVLPYAGMMALVHGVDLDVGGMTVDPVLLRNVRSGLAEAARWHGLRHVPLVAGAVESPVEEGPGRVAGVFFSGGIDSLFSTLRYRCGVDPPTVRDIAPLARAIHVYHAPQPAGPEAFATLEPLARSVAACGLGFVPVQSNMMTADRALHDRWADIGHGAGLATVLHLLSGGLRQGIIGSTHRWGALVPWGSSPVIDPLWSGRRMEVIHDDAGFGRVEKTALVATVPEALAGLNVCDIRVEGVGYRNCSRCPKCLRTMTTLDLFGVATPEAAPTFDWGSYTPSAFARVFVRTENDAAFAREIRAAAVARGRDDIVAACDAALRRGRALRPLARIEDAVKTSALGRRYRATLKAQRDRAYRALGWATKGG